MYNVNIEYHQLLQLTIYYENNIENYNKDYRQYINILNELKEEIKCKKENRVFFGTKYYCTIAEVETMLKEIKLKQYELFIEYKNFINLMVSQNIKIGNKVKIDLINNVRNVIDDVQKEIEILSIN